MPLGARGGNASTDVEEAREGRLGDATGYVGRGGQRVRIGISRPVQSGERVTEPGMEGAIIQFDRHLAIEQYGGTTMARQRHPPPAVEPAATIKPAVIEYPMEADGGVVGGFRPVVIIGTVIERIAIDPVIPRRDVFKVDARVPKESIEALEVGTHRPRGLIVLIFRQRVDLRQPDYDPALQPDHLCNRIER